MQRAGAAVDLPYSRGTPMVAQPRTKRILFLPGAAGSGDFWRPVAERLPFPCETVLFDWPGLGTVAADPRVTSLDDLVGLILSQMTGPVDLVAHSMGGVIAVHAALARPLMVRRLVLSATSGGVDTARFNALDWRPAYREAYPSAPLWIVHYEEDLSESIRSIDAPTLLLWGDADPISPVKIGQYLASLLPRAQLVIIRGGTHTFPRDGAPQVAAHIAEHLGPDQAGDPA